MPEPFVVVGQFISLRQRLSRRL